MLEITPVNMNLSTEFRSVKSVDGCLHSEFERVNNYLFLISNEERMLTVMSEGNTLLPDSIILKKEDYETFKKQADKSAQVSENFLITGQIKISFIKNTDCSLINLKNYNYNRESFEIYRKQIVNFCEASEKKSDFYRLPDKYNEYLNDFAEALISDNSSTAVLPFSKLIGAGKGLTPSADDAVIGVMAGYMLKLLSDNRCNIYLQCTKCFGTIVSNEKLTTKISLKYLRCACKGQFSRDLCMLILAFLKEDNTNILPILQSIKAVGHSSGMDMLYGLQTMLQKI